MQIHANVFKYIQIYANDKGIVSVQVLNKLYRITVRFKRKSNEPSFDLRFLVTKSSSSFSKSSVNKIKSKIYVSNAKFDIYINGNSPIAILVKRI